MRWAGANVMGTDSPSHAKVSLPSFRATLCARELHSSRHIRDQSLYMGERRRRSHQSGLYEGSAYNRRYGTWRKRIQRHFEIGRIAVADQCASAAKRDRNYSQALLLTHHG